MTKQYATNTEFYRCYGMTMADMARRCGVTRECVRLRFARGKPVDAPNMSHSVLKRKRAKMYAGKTIKEWAEELDVSIASAYYQIVKCSDPHVLLRQKTQKEQ